MQVAHGSSEGKTGGQAISTGHFTLAAQVKVDELDVVRPDCQPLVKTFIGKQAQAGAVIAGIYARHVNLALPFPRAITFCVSVNQTVAQLELG